MEEARHSRIQMKEDRHTRIAHFLLKNKIFSPPFFQDVLRKVTLVLVNSRTADADALSLCSKTVQKIESRQYYLSKVNNCLFKVNNFVYRQENKP